VSEVSPAASRERESVKMLTTPTTIIAIYRRAETICGLMKSLGERVHEISHSPGQPASEKSSNGTSGAECGCVSSAAVSQMKPFRQPA
jgi:hypothetical protein